MSEEKSTESQQQDTSQYPSTTDAETSITAAQTDVEVSKDTQAEILSSDESHSSADRDASNTAITATAGGELSGDEEDMTNPLILWILVLICYITLLIGIGYIAFWEQDFNKPKNTIGAYMDLFIDEAKEVTGDSAQIEAIQQFSKDEQFRNIVHEVMKNSADASADLQKLASQSFNILLGAVLAFLSATATMVFQRLSAKDGSTG